MNGRGVRWWMRFAVDPRSVREAQRAAADALDRGTNPVKPIQNLSRIEGAFGRVRSVVFSLQGMIAGLGLTLGFAQVLRFLVSTNREYERFIARLHTFEGSAEAARAAFARMERLAAVTPAQIENLVEAFVTLRSAGIRPTDEDILRLGDAASAAGGRIEDLAMAIRQAAVGETERLKAFNISARIQGDQITLTYGDISKTVRRSAAEIHAAVVEISEARFAGAMAREMDTLNGIISNTQDNFSTMARTIGQAGFTGALAEALKGFRDFTGEIATNEAGIAKWTNGILATVRAVFITFQNLGAGILFVFDAIGTTIASILLDVAAGTIQMVRTALSGINWLVDRANAFLPDSAVPFNRIDLTGLDRMLNTLYQRSEAAGRNIFTSLGALGTLAAEVANAFGDIQRSAREAELAARAAGAAAGSDDTGGGDGDWHTGSGTRDVLGSIAGGDPIRRQYLENMLASARQDILGLRDLLSTTLAEPLPAIADQAESFAERVDRIYSAISEYSDEAASGLAEGFHGAFAVLFADIGHLAEAFEALANGIINAAGRAVGAWAEKKAQENFIRAAEEVALGIAAAASIIRAPEAPGHFLAAAKFAAVGTAWAALAGGATAGANAITGGGRGGGIGGPGGSDRNVGGDLRDRFDNREIILNVYMDPLDPRNTVVQDVTYEAQQLATERHGSGARVQTFPRSMAPGRPR